MSPSAPNIYDYVDYRTYLRDFYATRKQQSSSFSFRYFARRAGIASPNFLKLVMDGKRNLGPDSIVKFAKGLGLDDDARTYFADLVALDQAATPAERTRAFERVAANKNFRNARRVEGPLFRYLQHWYNTAIRELAGRDGFREDPAWIAKQLVPPITTSQARAALDTLRELGLLVEDEQGQLVRGEPSLATGHEVRAKVIPAYHKQMIERAAAALHDIPPDERDISALTVCIRSASLQDLKSRIRRFREEILLVCDSEQEQAPEQVFQLCVQLFPLSRPTSDKPPS